MLLQALCIISYHQWIQAGVTVRNFANSHIHLPHHGQSMSMSWSWMIDSHAFGFRSTSICTPIPEIRPYQTNFDLENSRSRLQTYRYGQRARSYNLCVSCMYMILYDNKCLMKWNFFNWTELNTVATLGASASAVPVGTRRNNYVIMTSKRCRDVVLTSYRRYYCVVCPLGWWYWPPKPSRIFHQTFADKRWVGPVKLPCIIMSNISKIRPKSFLGPVKAQKFLRCLYHYKMRMD